MPRYIVEVDCTLRLNWLEQVEVEADDEEQAQNKAVEDVDYDDVAERMVQAALADGPGSASWYDAYIIEELED